MPDAEKLVPVPATVLTVIAADIAPVTVGTKLTLAVHVAPAAIVALAAQVPADKVKSVASLFDSGVADKVTGPPEAVIVRLPHETGIPTVLLPQTKDVGAAINVPLTPVPDSPSVLCEALLVTVTKASLSPVEVGVNESCPLVQDAPAASTKFAVQEPGSKENCGSELANGAADKVTEPPPLAVNVTVPQVPVVFTP